ncbi:ABC transporter permease [Liquorilactobacillus sicerae]|uniref:ABC transporter permease n=1 Tax=Liquorilactobacillus sicerae TaxID=1416943 RepID=UPI0024806EFD|nr:ABC transporter permease subunit [Liquorilactobacillus sicerae]
MSSKLKIFLPFIILVLLVLVLPIIMMIISSFQSTNGAFTVENYEQAFSSHYYREAIFNSLWISFVTSLASLVISIVGAWSLTKLKNTTKNVLISIFNMSSSFAGVPLAFSLIILFGNAGVLHAITKALSIENHLNIYSLTGMIFAYTFFEIPLGIMFLFPVLNEINPEWQEASQTLGAKKIFFLSNVIFPTILPNIVEVFTLLFANAMGTYETAYALVGDNVVSIPTLIGSLINGEIIANVPLACTFATLFAIFMTLLVWMGNKFTRTDKRG